MTPEIQKCVGIIKRLRFIADGEDAGLGPTYAEVFEPIAEALRSLDERLSKIEHKEER